jgi:hypothetical protein
MTDPLPRRAMLKSAVVAGGATLLATQLNADDAKGSAAKCTPVAMEKAHIVTPAHVSQKNVSINISPDKLAQTFMFDSLQVTYGPEKAAQKFTPVKTAFIEIPLSAGSDPQCELLGYTIDVGGSVDLTAGARASVTLIFGGDVEQISFPFGDAGTKDFKRRFFSLAKLAGTPGKAVIRSPLHLQIILAVETAQPDDAAVLSVDAIDVEARRAR